MRQLEMKNGILGNSIFYLITRKNKVAVNALSERSSTDRALTATIGYFT